MKRNDKAKIFACGFAGFMEGFGVPFALYLVSGLIDKLAIWLFWPMIGVSIFTGLCVAAYEAYMLRDKIHKRDQLAGLINEVKPKIYQLWLLKMTMQHTNNLLLKQLHDLDKALGTLDTDIQAQTAYFEIIKANMGIIGRHGLQKKQRGTFRAWVETAGSLLRKVAVPVAAVISAVFAVFVDAVELVDHMPRMIWHGMLGALAALSLVTASMSMWLKGKEKKTRAVLKTEFASLENQKLEIQTEIHKLCAEEQIYKMQIDFKQKLLTERQTKLPLYTNHQQLPANLVHSNEDTQQATLTRDANKTCLNT